MAIHVRKIPPVHLDKRRNGSDLGPVVVSRLTTVGTVHATLSMQVDSPIWFGAVASSTGECNYLLLICGWLRRQRSAKPLRITGALERSCPRYWTGSRWGRWRRWRWRWAWRGWRRRRFGLARAVAVDRRVVATQILYTRGVTAIPLARWCPTAVLLAWLRGWSWWY